MRKRLTKAGDSHAATLSKETLELPGMLVVFAQPNVTGCWHLASYCFEPKPPWGGLFHALFRFSQAVRF